MAGAFTFFVLLIFPVGMAGFLAYRIIREIDAGRSYLRGWNDARTQPALYWFNIVVKAFGAIAFLAIPVSIFGVSVRQIFQ